MIARSFRGRLALRFSIIVALLSLAGSAMGHFAFRQVLYQRLDVTLLRLAGIEAAAMADSPDESVHFHDDLFPEVTPEQETVLSRFAEVWSVDGDPVDRTMNLQSRDLPLPDEVRDRVVASGERMFFDFTWREARYRAILYPLLAIGSQHELHLLQVATSTEETEDVLRGVVLWLIGMVLIGSVVGGLTGWWVAGRAVSPVMEIIRQAELLEGSGAGHHIAAEADTDEMKRLVAVLNAMLGRIDATLESQRRFLADAGHAIKTPLTVLRGDVDVTLRRERSPEEYRRVLSQTLEDLRDVSSLAEDLITLARSDSGELGGVSRTVPVRGVCDRVVRTFERAADRLDVRLSVDVNPDVTVCHDPVLLERAVASLVDNALRYGAHPGHVTVAAALRNGHVEVIISDDGPGIPEAERALVFERFYRGDHGRRNGRGTGLGLAIVNAIMTAAGGTVELRRAAGGGATVALVFRD